MAISRQDNIIASISACACTYLWPRSTIIPLQCKVSVADVVDCIYTKLIGHDDAVDEFHYIALRWINVVVYFEMAETVREIDIFEHLVEMTRLVVARRLIEDLIVVSGE